MSRWFILLMMWCLGGCGVFLVGATPDDGGTEPDAESKLSYRNDVDLTGDSSSEASLDGGSLDAKKDTAIDWDACPLHDDGLGGTYKSCGAIGLHNSSRANDACNSFIRRDGGVKPPSAYCTTNPTYNCRGQDGTIVGSEGMPDDQNAMWDFAGDAAGHARLWKPSDGLVCPVLTDPTWN